MFVHAEEIDRTVALYWDGSPEKADTLVNRSAAQSPSFTYTSGVLDLAGTGPVGIGSWIVWDTGLADPNQNPVVLSDTEFRTRYRLKRQTF